MSELPKILLILPYKMSCVRVSLEIPLLSLDAINIQLAPGIQRPEIISRNPAEFRIN